MNFKRGVFLKETIILKVNGRFVNPLFWVNLMLSVSTPVFAYYGVSQEDITTWGNLFVLIGNALKNPYVCFVIFINLINTYSDPTKKIEKGGYKNANKAIEG